MSWKNRVAAWFGASEEGAEEQDLFSDLLSPEYLGDLLPYRLFDAEKGVFENRRSAGFAIEAMPLLGGSLEAETEFTSLVRSLGEEGANIQCLLFADPRIDPFLAGWAKGPLAQGGVYAKVAGKKQAFFRGLAEKGSPPPRIFRFFLSYSRKKPAANLDAFFEDLAIKKRKALETCSRVSHAFEVDPNRLLNLLAGMLQCDAREWDPETFLSRQAASSSSALEVRRDCLMFHTAGAPTRVRTYEAIDVPDTWSLAHSAEWLGDFFNAPYRIPAPFYLHYGIHFPSKEKTAARLGGKLKILEHQSKFPYLHRMLPNLSKELEENLHVRNQLAEGELFVETRLSMGLFASEARFPEAESTLLALFQKHGFRLQANDFIHLPDFLASLPMSWGEDTASMSGLKRMRCMRTTLTEETSRLIPCVGEWWGNARQGLILTGRRGQIACWDPFATEGNLNTVVVGPSGSGKSVFMQDMLFNHLAQGGRVFVLDLGRSFEKLCHLLEGQYLAFSEKSRLDLNPFHRIDGDNPEQLNASLEMVAGIIATMAMPTQVIDRERADILATLVKKAWELEGRNSTIDTLIRLIDEMSFHSELMRGAVESVKEGLKKYSQSGVYAPYFYGERSIDFSSPFVVIETEELKNMADLQAVVLQIFTLEIARQIFLGDRKTRCLICIDEAWDLLKSPQMEGFIESLARRLRKYNGALVVGTQSIKDFDRSAGAKAAFQNSNWLVMLGKDNDSINLLVKDQLIQMNEYREAALSSLRMESGRYSEFFLYHKGSGSAMVGQLRLDPFSAMLFSTKAEEFQAVYALQAKGLPIDEALECLEAGLSVFKQELATGASVAAAAETIYRKGRKV